MLPGHEPLPTLRMPFRPRIPLRRLLPHLQRYAPRPPAPQRRSLSYAPSSAALSAAATESEEEAAVVGRDAPPLAPPRSGGPGGGPPGRGWAREGAFEEKEAELERKASVAARLRLCHELVWQRRWQDMRSEMAQMVGEQGELGLSVCVCISN